MTRTARKYEIAQELDGAIRKLLSERLSRYGYLTADIGAGLDRDGDPVLTIDAHYRLSQLPIDPDVTFELLTDLVGLVHEHGEERFPHIRHHYHEQQKVKGFP